jgi:hypothetical protein
VYVSGVPDWVKRVSPVLFIHNISILLMVFNILSKFNIPNGNRYITDDNDIRPHTAQIYNERTSTDLNVVTA